jgi:glycosyltransferase involved in cell wall biosynthesis
MKVAQISTYDTFGGAARASLRIHRALLRYGIQSELHVDRGKGLDWTVKTPGGKVAKALKPLWPEMSVLVNRLMKTPSAGPISVAMLPSAWPRRINASDADVVNLHWICSEMMSVEDIGRIRKPVVWTLHDMWPFCGAEHYTDSNRWIDGYDLVRRPEEMRGVDLHRWVWRRKCRAWQRPMQIVTPSRWLADCVRRSKLMQDWPVQVIPNALDMDVWCPIDRSIARQLLNFPDHVQLIAFGAIGGGADLRKGSDLLMAALGHLRGEIEDLELIIFGEYAPKEIQDLGFPVHYTGPLYDDLTLRSLYSAVNAIIIPSRQDNLPNVGLEALACGVPVVAFDIGGMADIVDHQHTGWLARAFDTERLAQGIQWVLRQADELRPAARAKAVEQFSYPVVASQYLALYEDVVAKVQI